MKQDWEFDRLYSKVQGIQPNEDPIQKTRKIISGLHETRQKRLEDLQNVIAEKDIELSKERKTTLHKIVNEKNKRIASKRNSKENKNTTEEISSKNPEVSDTDRMLFDKKFKNYLNHRNQFQEKAKRRREAILEGRNKQKESRANVDDYYNEDEILSNTGSDYQYKDAEDMKGAFDVIATGKRRKKGVELFHAQKFQFAFRFEEFETLLGLMEDSSEALISKDLFLNYLFEEPLVMMLYSINPYLLGDQISDYDTKVNGMLSFEEFSSFLLEDREPTYFDYSKENLEEARRIGRGLKCAPIVGKWIDETGIYEMLIEIFQGVDIFGRNEAERNVLARKMKRQAQNKRLMDIEVVEVVNINKTLPLSRLIYEIEFELTEKQKWTRKDFQNYLQHYKRLMTPDKDKLITKLIMSGSYDSSYIYVVSQEVLDTIKVVFESMQKFAEFFVKKEKFVEKFCAHSKYRALRNMKVRTEGNRYVVAETVEESLVRFLNQADNYVDIEEILEFFTNRGRPRLIEYQVYIANLERQLAIIEEQEIAKLKKMQEMGEDYLSTSSDEEFDKIVREKRLKRKIKKIEDIRKGLNYEHNKKFNVTIPVPFKFDERDKGKKMSIREKKLKQMLEDKRNKQNEAMKPIPPKEVPPHAKINLFEKMMKDQERERQERLEKFRMDIKNSMVPVSERLTKPKSKSIRGKFSKQQYKFVARPMPWYCEVNLVDRINRKKEERRERIMEEVLSRHQENDLPDGVLRMLQRHEKLQEKRLNKRTAATSKMDECTFIPKISGQVPDFQALHEALKMELEIARENKQPLVAEPFSFENRQKRSRTVHDPHQQRKRVMSQSHQYKFDEREVDIKPTLKYKALVDYRRRQNEDELIKIDEENRNSQVRRMRKQKFAPYVRQVLKKNDTELQKSRKIMESRIHAFRKQQQKKKKQYEDQMIKIYTNVWNRPLLLESTGQFGENEIKKNTRFYEDDEMALREQYQGRQQEKINEEYEERRRRAIEQPPGQYLMQQQDLNEQYQQYEPNYEAERYDQDDFEQEYLENGGLRTH